MVEVLVLEPTLIGHGHQHYQQCRLTHQPPHGFPCLLLPVGPVGGSHGHIEQGEQIVGRVVFVMLVHHEIEGQLGPVDVGLVHLVVHISVAHQRHGNHREQGQHRVHEAHPLLFQPPAHHTHQHRWGQSIDAKQRIAYHGRHYHQHSPQVILPRQLAEHPQHGRGEQRPQGSHKDMPPQFQDINPVAHVHDGQQQQHHGHQHQQGPFARNTESPFHHPHQQQPQPREHQHAHPGVVEELRQPGAHIGQHSPRHHHLLPEEQASLLEKVQFLRFPQEVALEEQQSQGNHRQSQGPQNAIVEPRSFNSLEPFCRLLLLPFFLFHILFLCLH